MKNVVSAGFIIYTITNGELLFLVLQYAVGHWDFAKGKIEETESLHDAALRELYEETGLKPDKIADFNYSFEYTFIDYDGKYAHKNVVLFLAHVTLRNVRLSDEHQAYCWISYKDALDRLTYANAQAALKGAYSFMSDKKFLPSF